MTDARPALALAAVAGHPDHLAAEALLAEDAIAEHLRLVHGARIEVQPQRPAWRQEGARHDDPRLEPREIRVERAPCVVVGNGALRARSRNDARAEALLHLERRVEVRDVCAAGLDIRAELEGVGVDEQVSRGSSRGHAGE